MEEPMEQHSSHVDRVLSALEQARAGQGVPLDMYLKSCIANGTATREGYELALAEEIADAMAQ
jgi:hypothetical protein